MANPTFNPGDLVAHKAHPSHKMVVLGPDKQNSALIRCAWLHIYAESPGEGKPPFWHCINDFFVHELEQTSFV